MKLAARIWNHLAKHARPWISKLEPKEPGPGAVGIQFEYELDWPEVAQKLSEEENSPARRESVKHQKPYETATPELPAQT